MILDASRKPAFAVERSKTHSRQVDAAHNLSQNEASGATDVRA
jgi:hypothetical protein